MSKNGDNQNDKNYTGYCYLKNNQEPVQLSESLNKFFFNVYGFFV